MNIKIIAVGKIKADYLRAAIAEYSKRLKAFVKLEIIEVSDEKAPEKLSAAERDIVLAKEGERILKQIDKDFVIICDLAGKNLSSEQLADKFKNFANDRVVDIAFVIGGSLGLDGAVKQRANMALSFGKMTYPHQLMRVLLLEQIYRAFCINSGKPYHK